jgi:hypothetical protein
MPFIATGCNLALLQPLATHLSDPRLFGLIFRAVIVVVCLGMNLIYWLLWKNGKNDYFESLPEDKKRLLLQPEEEEYTVVPQPPPVSGRSRHCRCGFNLGDDPSRWLAAGPDVPSRCPGCSRVVDIDEWDAPVIPAGEQAMSEEVPAITAGAMPQVSAPQAIEPPAIDTAPAEEDIADNQDDAVDVEPESDGETACAKPEPAEDVIGLIV